MGSLVQGIGCAQDYWTQHAGQAAHQQQQVMQKPFLAGVAVEKIDLGDFLEIDNKGLVKKAGTKEKKMNMVREYINKHRDILFTLTVALLVDHFVLNGALRSRIQRVIEAALGKMEKALGIEEKVVS